MDIPPELKLEVLQHLEKNDVKAVRLVNKKWSICTPKFLFNRIYWSLQDPDLQVFQNIVSHQVLAGCVKELVFDGSQFGIGVTKRQYFDDLCLQIEELFDFILSWSVPVDGGDPEVDTLVNTIRTGTSAEMFEGREELWTLCGKFKFVDEGYRKWRMLAQNQLTRMGDTRTLRIFTEGLTKLCNLKSVTLSPRWFLSLTMRYECFTHQQLPKTYSYGSPLARSWSLFHTNPSPWENNASGHRKRIGTSNGFPELQFLSLALSQANSRPSKLAIGDCDLWGIAPISDSNKDCVAMWKTFDIAYQNLTHLTIHFAVSFALESPSVHKTMFGLGRFLVSLVGLECLTLELPYGDNPSEPHCNYNRVFNGRHGHWPKLWKLDIYKLDIGIKDLTRLLTLDLPELRDLNIGQMELLDGPWEWMIEYMRNFVKLEKFHIWLDAELINADGGHDLQETTSDDQIETDEYGMVMNKVVDYVLHGGRHPSLPSHQLAAASEGYIEKLQEFLALEA